MTGSNYSCSIDKLSYDKLNFDNIDNYRPTHIILQGYLDKCVKLYLEKNIDIQVILWLHHDCNTDYLKNTLYDYIYIKFIYFGSKLEKTPENIPINLIYCQKLSNFTVKNVTIYVGIILILQNIYQPINING